MFFVYIKFLININVAILIRIEVEVPSIDTENDEVE